MIRRERDIRVRIRITEVYQGMGSGLERGVCRETNSVRTAKTPRSSSSSICVNELLLSSQRRPGINIRLTKGCTTYRTWNE